MEKSESIANIAAALVKFNSKVAKISKDAKNPQFRSEYVTLDALIEATRPLLQEAGLSVLQFPLAKEGAIGVQTMLIHESGEYISSDSLYMTPVRMVKGGEFEAARDPQAAGSTISYLRRYSYQAILNLNTGEDDDGNKATPAYANNGRHQKLSDAQLKRMYAIANKANYDASAVVKCILKKYGCKPQDMSKQQYDDICNGYQSIGAENGN